ncbi:hypothetical protein BKA80DRAFT_266694 [Phyllosticta citrichinensis]
MDQCVGFLCSTGTGTWSAGGSMWLLGHRPRTLTEAETKKKTRRGGLGSFDRHASILLALPCQLVDFQLVALLWLLILPSEIPRARFCWPVFHLSGDRRDCRTIE